MGCTIQYSIVVENITAEETRDRFKAFAINFLFFYVYYILNLEYPKKLELTFF